VTVWWILHHPIQYIKNCWVRLLSNYNIKYICTIYTRLATCLMSIYRFSLRDVVTLRLLKLYLVEWSRALAKRLVWVKIRRGKKKNLTAQKSNSNIVWFNFQTFIYIYIYICHGLFCLQWVQLRWEVIVRFVANGGIDDHYCLYFLFINLYLNQIIHVAHATLS
jgi:hypothetical protein